MESAEGKRGRCGPFGLFAPIKHPGSRRNQWQSTRKSFEAKQYGHKTHHYGTHWRSDTHRTNGCLQYIYRLSFDTLRRCGSFGFCLAGSEGRDAVTRESGP